MGCFELQKTQTPFCTADFLETQCIQNFKANGRAVLVLALGEHDNL